MNGDPTENVVVIVGIFLFGSRSLFHHEFFKGLNNERFIARLFRFSLLFLFYLSGCDSLARALFLLVVDI